MVRHFFSFLDFRYAVSKEKKKESVLGLKIWLGVTPACSILREKHHSKNYFGLSKILGRKEDTTKQAVDLNRIEFGKKWSLQKFFKKGNALLSKWFTSTTGFHK